MSSVLNPVRTLIEALGRGLVRLGLLSPSRARRISELAWPRIVTGLARMSKATADVAMVGTALGASAIAGVGYGVPFWTMTFMLGGGIAGGTISLVSQRFGAARRNRIGAAISMSAFLALLVTLPLVGLFCAFPEPFIRLIGTGEDAIRYGTDYLRVASLAMPFSALNLIASRALIGADDARTPMIVRTGGALVNVLLNGVLIFVFGLGVVGAAVGSVLGSIGSSLLFAWGLARGRLPLVGPLPIRINPSHVLWSLEDARHLARISGPLALRKLTQHGAQFPMLAIVGVLGSDVVAAYVIALRVRALMNTPGWGFGLASSSLVGQALGRGDESEAETYAWETFYFTVAAFTITGLCVFLGATPVSRLFLNDGAALDTTAALVRAACVSVLLWGVMNGAMGPLRASGDTRWPFYGQLAGIFVFSLPAAYLGTTTGLGLWGLYAAFVFETGIPAAVIYYRMHSRSWVRVGRRHRSQTVGA